jgi:hypothetical protein
MIDGTIAWMLSHPLQGVGLLVVFAVVVSLALIPRIHEVTDHGHPRC